MQKKTWKTVAITSIGVAATAVVILYKTLVEFDKVMTQNTDLLKQMADEGLIENLKIGGEPYIVES